MPPNCQPLSIVDQATGCVSQTGGYFYSERLALMPDYSAEQIEQLIEAAAERGAHKALQRLGLQDDTAPKDVADLRGLLETWRDVRKTIVRTVTGIVTALILTLLVAGSATEIWKKGAGE